MTNGAFVRRDIWAVEQGADDPPWDAYTLGYARAVGVMRERDPDDPTSWSYQAALHGTYRQPADPLWNGCQHGSWLFLPWHRIYIWYFEQIVRSVVLEDGGPDDWALPYWNYTDGPPGSAALPPGFRAETLPDDSPNPSSFPMGIGKPRSTRAALCRASSRAPRRRCAPRRSRPGLAACRGDRCTSRIRTACLSPSPTTTSTSWSAAISRRSAATRVG